MNDSDPASWVYIADKAVSILRGAKDLLPKSKDQEELQKALQEADEKLQLARAMQAADLGYDICECDFPPGISLRQRDGSHRCNKCGRNTDEDYRSTGGGSY